jgi:NADH-quinone oxidoreductase subunit N
MTLAFFHSDCFAILPELMLMGLGVIAIALSFTKLKYSPLSFHAILWGQVIVYAFSSIAFLQRPLHFDKALFGGMLLIGAGNKIACLALQFISIVIAWMSRRVSQKQTRLGLEFFGLLTAATVSLMFFVKAGNLVSLFVSLEASSLFITLMLALSSNPRAAARTALKYLVQSALSAVIMLWGIALVYAAAGSLAYDALSCKLLLANSPWGFAGVGLIIASLAFKLGLFPFFYYLPEIYENAGYPALAFLASSSKLAAAVALIALIGGPLVQLSRVYAPVLTALVGVTAVWAALGALHQTNLKRLLALSGSVHTSFIIACALFSSLMPGALWAVAFYFAVYIAALLLALYGLVELDLENPTMETLKNCHRRHPGFAILLALAFASMAGLPPLGGFIAKFLVFLNGILTHNWPLVAALIAGSVIALCYYLRVLFAVFGRHTNQPEAPEAPQLTNIPLSTRVFMGFMAFVILVLGLIQGPISFAAK